MAKVIAQRLYLEYANCFSDFWRKQFAPLRDFSC